MLEEDDLQFPYSSPKGKSEEEEKDDFKCSHLYVWEHGNALSHPSSGLLQEIEPYQSSYINLCKQTIKLGLPCSSLKTQYLQDSFTSTSSITIMPTEKI